MTRRLLAWWFFWAIAGGSGGITGPFETQAGCEHVRTELHAWFLSPISTQRCVSDRAPADR